MMNEKRQLTTVQRIIDGDSLILQTGNSEEHVRLYAMDAPEHGQEGGYDARNALVQMLGKQTFWMEPVNQDRYGRTVAILYHLDQHRRNSVNLRMVKEGYAYAYTKYGGRGLGVHQAEADARRGRRGIWRDSPQGGERPWKHRAENRVENRKERADGSTLIWIIIAIAILITTCTIIQ